MDEGEWKRDSGRQTERSKNVGEERKLGTGELISLFSEIGKLFFGKRRWEKQKTTSDSKENQLGVLTYTCWHKLRGKTAI